MHLYLHVPYCAAKCPYCDFNSIAGREDEHAAYVEALLAEVARLPAVAWDTVFVGGGTPSSLGPVLLARLFAGLAGSLRLADGCEWTCEANPGSSDAERFRIMAEHGVNRISLGVQSTHEHHLRYLGRVHSGREAEAAIAAALECVPRVSADLILGLPGQTEDELRSDLGLYRRHGLGHASVYHLAIEPGTDFAARHARGELHEIDAASSRRQLALAAQTLVGLGLGRYETSNFARPGQECRHNLMIWRGADYHAAGAGAVSTVGGVRLTREKHPARYIAAIAAGGDAVWKREDLDARERRREAWMLGLRLSEGVSRRRLLSLGDDEGRWLADARRLADGGFAALDADGVRIPEDARHLQDEITIRLMP